MTFPTFTTFLSCCWNRVSILLLSVAVSTSSCSTAELHVTIIIALFRTGFCISNISVFTNPIRALTATEQLVIVLVAVLLVFGIHKKVHFRVINF